MKLLTIKTAVWIPDDVHEIDFKKSVIGAFDMLGVIFEEVAIIQNDFTPESKKQPILSAKESKKRYNRLFKGMK